MSEHQTPGEAAWGFLLETDADGTRWLRARHRPHVDRLRADWLGPEQQRRIAGGKKQLLARAVGIGRKQPLRVLDATGGMGRDANTLVMLGAEVTLTERHPLIFALLESARDQWALRHPTFATRLNLLHVDAHSLLQADGDWDVVYLDPMYPHRNKAALPGKEMQFFRELTDGDSDADALLPLARARARWRAVVKRPLSAPPLGNCAADQSLRGTQARFDLYLSPPCDTSR